MSKTLTLLSTFAASLLAGNTVFAQQDSVKTSQLDEVVVTASRVNLKQSQTGKVVTVIDQKMIANNQGRTITELLNTQTSFFIAGSNNTLGTNQDLYFRGAGTGSMLIVVDGIPVYDPSSNSNSFDLNNIALDQVERIEILRGGQSSIWGSDAVSGVIQIFMKKGSGRKTTVNGSAAYGTYNTFRSGAGISGSANKLGYNVQYSFTKSDGMPSAYDSTGVKDFKKDGFEQTNVLAELHYQFNHLFSAKAFGNFGVFRTDLPGGAFTDEKDYTARNRNAITGLSLQYHKNDFTWNLMGSYQRVNRLFVNDSGYVSSIYAKYFRGEYTGNSYVFETFAAQKFSSHVQLVGGIQHIRQSTDQSYFSTGAFGPFKTTLGKDSVNIKQTAAYASFLVTGLSGFNLEAGGRINKHSIYGTNATYTFNPSYNIDEHTKLFVNISSAFKIPTLYQLYSEYGNKNLKPEKSVTYEIGVQTQSSDKKQTFRVTAFKRDIKNLIIFYTDPTFFSQYVNRNEQHDYGFEVESNTQLAAIGNWSNSFSFIDGQGVENGKRVDNLYRRPKFVFNSALTLQPIASLTLIPSFKYVGSRLKGPYDAGPAEQPHYYTVDFYAGYTVSKKIRLFLDLRNITDQQYFDVVGYNSKRFNMMTGLNITF